MLESGHDVVVLADFGAEYLKEWEIYRRKSKFKGTLYVRHVSTVLQRQEVHRSNSIFMTKSRSFALALKLVYDEVPFDIVECFDYAGVAYELLRRKELVKDDYLPRNVMISIRFHGTLQLIDRAEKNEVDITVPSERSMMYLQERFSIYSADLLFCQTKFMISKLAAEYGANEKELLYAPAPLESILETVDEANSQLEIAPTWHKSFDFLIYGRFQLVKGLETIVMAAISLLRGKAQQSDLNNPIRFLFVGPDQYSEDHRMLASAYLESLIPTDLKKYFVFYPKPINRTELVAYSRKVRAAIFASKFETLNLAVHEMARLRVPLILSKIPAFEEYFSSSQQVVFFDAGNYESLRKAIKTAVDENYEKTIYEIRQGRFQLQYDDATAAYRFYNLPNPRRRDREKSLEYVKLIQNMDARI